MTNGDFFAHGIEHRIVVEVAKGFFRGSSLRSPETFLGYLVSSASNAAGPLFLKKKLEDVSPFCGATDTPVLDF